MSGPWFYYELNWLLCWLIWRHIYFTLASYGQIWSCGTSPLSQLSFTTRHQHMTSSSPIGWWFGCPTTCGRWGFFWQEPTGYGVHKRVRKVLDIDRYYTVSSLDYLSTSYATSLTCHTRKCSGWYPDPQGSKTVIMNRQGSLYTQVMKLLFLVINYVFV